MEPELTVATCQFPVSADIKRNKSHILKQLAEAKSKGPEIVHFPESSLSSYAEMDFESIESQDETLLQSSFEQVIQLAAKLKIWVVVGSHHFGDDNDQPYNCLWLINEKGDVVDLYDKRFLTGKPGKLDRCCYQPGHRTVQFQIKAITCGLLICHEWRYPELYREQTQLGSEILFQSWYDGDLGAAEYEKEGADLGSLIVGTVRGNAANNYLWISASNTSKRESCFAGFIVQPDGKVLQRLRRNASGALISRLNIDKKFADPSGPWRKRAMDAITTASPGPT
jgi:predicted amidohydrolase